MDSPEKQKIPSNLNQQEIEILRAIWLTGKKEAKGKQLSGSELTNFMLDRMKSVIEDEKRIRLYRGTTSRPIARNLRSRTDFTDNLPGEYWTTDVEKARHYSDLGGNLFQVDLTADELCDRTLVSVTDSFDEFRVLSKEIQSRALIAL